MRKDGKKGLYLIYECGIIIVSHGFKARMFLEK